MDLRNLLSMFPRRTHCIIGFRNLSTTIISISLAKNCHYPPLCYELTPIHVDFCPDQVCFYHFVSRICPKLSVQGDIIIVETKLRN